MVENDLNFSKSTPICDAKNTAKKSEIRPGLTSIELFVETLPVKYGNVI